MVNVEVVRVLLVIVRLVVVIVKHGSSATPDERNDAAALESPPKSKAM